MHTLARFNKYHIQIVGQEMLVQIKIVALIYIEEHMMNGSIIKPNFKSYWSMYKILSQ